MSLSLSAETLAALKMFAVESGVEDAANDDGTEDIISKVQNHFDVKERDDNFNYDFGKGTEYAISVSLSGVKREIGQTLSSTGLTIWRAAEHLAIYIYNHADQFSKLSILELGAGLGLVSILLDKLKCCGRIVCTDGDDDTLELLERNVNANKCDGIEVKKLWWGENDVFLKEMNGSVNNTKDAAASAPSTVFTGAASSVASEKASFYGFDVVIAADVIYEDDQVEPLLNSVVATVNKKGKFLLAFARRNVPMDKVLAEADRVGLCWTVLSSERERGRNTSSSEVAESRPFEKYSDCRSEEPIYQFTFKESG